MNKGADLAETSRFLHDAKRAGISVRVTMIVGYPGEEAGDVDSTIRFLSGHDGCIERVALNRFQIICGARFHRRLEKDPAFAPQVSSVETDHPMAQVSHHYAQTEDRSYRRAVSRLIRAVHEINRRPLSPEARAFEGVM